MKRIKLQSFSYLPALAIGCIVSVAMAATQAKIIGAVLQNGKAFATISTNGTTKKVVLPNAAAKSNKFLISENGQAVLYESVAKAKGGYEGENAAVIRYSVSGKYNTLLDEPLNLESLRTYQSRRGRTAYVVTMADGGAGIPTVYVCSTKGKVWHRTATRVSGFRNGRVILNRYPKNEEAGNPNARPIGKIYLDLDKLLRS